MHLHSIHSVAASVLADVDPDDVLPPLTAYYVMRIGRLPLVPYFPPGDAAWRKRSVAYAGRHHAVLLANHGRWSPARRLPPPPTPSRNSKRPRGCS